MKNRSKKKMLRMRKMKMKKMRKMKMKKMIEERESSQRFLRKNCKRQRKRRKQSKMQN